MTQAALTNEQLAAFRERADAVLDPLIDALPKEAVSRTLGVLFRSEGLPDDPVCTQLLAALPHVPVRDEALLAEGQALFQLYGPEILLILGCYGLPAAYAAANGVEVIRRARRLRDDTKRRLCETAQMLIDVMIPGGFAVGQISARSSVKVRLIHGLVRRHVRELSPWSAELGKPINQEDLCGTLLTFSVLVLDGLRRLGARLSEREQQGYLEVWRHIGAVLGIDERLTPRTMAEAQQLAVQIGQRQFRPSAAGTALTRELVTVTNSLFPVRGYGLSLMRFFLDESVFGLNLATLLELPPANFSRWLVSARATQKRFVLKLLNQIPGARVRRRVLSSFFTQALILLQRPDKQSPFEVPEHWLSSWRVRAATPATATRQ